TVFPSGEICGSVTLTYLRQVVKRNPRGYSRQSSG
ncbi:MAG: hypothetical protein JWQ49_1481, partial [Edaphobacter sp.]|nr:hypothetical protein [Edaphobacter sp.]